MTTTAALKSRQAATRAEPTRRAKLFWNGRSQAVRLPKEFRFPGDEVVISREGDRIVLSPARVERDAKGWPRLWWALAGAVPELDLGDRHRPHERADPLRPGRS